MPINKDLSLAPYFDDFDAENQYYRVMFKPGYAVQARELTQLQTMLQNQVEQFGDNIFKEGSIVKGCNFTNLDGLEFVKLNDVLDDPSIYESKAVEEEVNGQIIELDYVYELTGADSGLKADIVSSARGTVLNAPNLNTFFINYKNTSTTGQKQFLLGESLSITLYKFKRGTTDSVFPSTAISTPGLAVYGKVNPANPHVGKSFGIQSAPGVIFQKGHFLFADEQILIVSKYDTQPSSVSVGYKVNESVVNALQDGTLYDNANGSVNQNAPGADRLKLVPTLTVIPTDEADADSNFFTLIRYQTGNAITVRDVSQYNVLGEEMARRTYEESGNYILSDFPLATDDRIPDGSSNTEVHVLVGTGTAYVKGYRVENSAERAFAIDQIINTEEVQNQAVSTNYGNYVDIIEFNGTVDLNHASQVNLVDSGSNNIGTTFVHNLTPERAYLFGTRLNSGKKFSDVVTLTDGSGDVVVANTTVTATLRETNKSPLIFKTGVNSCVLTSDTLIPVRVSEPATQTSNVITITANADEDFVCDNDDILVVDNSSTYIPVLSAVTSLNNSVLTITLDPTGGPHASNVTVYYNKRMIGTVDGVEPYNKIVKEPYVKVDYSTGTTKYNLGFPDVFGITSIEDASGNDYTNSFRLNSNQKDTYYDLSFIEYIQGRPEPSGKLTIKLKVFQLSTSTGEYFFTINSYPNTLESYDIPAYVSEGGATYNLRECFDFRPHMDKDALADYNNVNPASAPTITNAVGLAGPTFANNGSPLIPAVDQAVTTDLEYYLSRIDTIVCDSYGEISLIKGEEQKYPAPAKVQPDQLAIANVFIPGYPALSSRQADSQRKRDYAVKAKPIGVRNYTMKDLNSLERKIDNMAYYISLSQLETETQNFNILDENGLNRFKNGFAVDPFNDLSLSQIESPEFNAAIAFNRKILTPSVKTFPLDLKYKTSTGSSLFPSGADAKVATLGRDSNVAVINQPSASGFRNCVSNFYKYSGEGAISPPFDAAYDTTTNPVTIEVDLETPFRDFVDNLQEFLPLTDTDVTERRLSWAVVPDRGNLFPRRATQLVEEIEQTTVARQLTMDSNINQSLAVGDFVSNFQFQPFMAARDIKVYMSGLRPNIRHYFFFDKQDVNAHIIPGSAADNVNDVQRVGQFGQAVTTDENGVLRAVFRIPAETFYVGDRVLEIVDVDTYSSIEASATSTGFVTYRAYNFSVEKTSLTTTTRTPDFSVATTTTTRNVVRRSPGPDPLAQTFFVKKGMGLGSNSIFLSKVDVYFKRVSETNGITLELREVINGFPSNQIIPFSVVHKNPSDLTSAVSDDASATTSFEFQAPVRLDVEKEYAVVLKPDAADPNYLVYISQVGGVDLTPGATQGQSIVQDWGDGVLFTSTNNSAWKSYQDEDLKFTLHRHNFNESTGSVTLTANDLEFLAVDDITGRFNPGELIYQEKALSGGTQATVSIPLDSNVMTGVALDETYSVGDHILVENAGGTLKDVFVVSNVDSTTQLTLNKPASFLVSGGTATPIVVGNLSYYNLRNPFEMHLEQSSARTGRTFSVASDIIGFDSESTANVASIDDINLSYVQPMIFKANDSSSTTSLVGTFVPPADVNSTYQTGMKFNDNNNFSLNGVVVYSKSNDPSDSKAFDFKINMANQSNETSTPLVDIEVSKLLAYQYKITNDVATTSKYISKTVDLAAGLDAEDLNVFVTGYRPNGSDIKVYIRPQSAFDSDRLDNIDWIELELFEGVGVFSSSSNVNDYREYSFRVAESDKDVDGALTYTSNAGDFSGFRRFEIRIALTSSNVYNAPTLRDYRAIALT